MSVPKVVMRLYVDQIENNNAKALVIVVANDTSIGNATPFVVGVEPVDKSKPFAVGLERDQLDRLINAVASGRRKLRLREGASADDVVDVNMDPGTVVITDPGGGDNGPKLKLQAALDKEKKEAA